MRKLYLLGNTLDKFPVSKLPKNSLILRRFFDILGTCDGMESKLMSDALHHAAGLTADEIRLVWRFHYGLRLVNGKETDFDKTEDESLKLIVRKDKIKDKILKL